MGFLREPWCMCALGTAQMAASGQSNTYRTRRCTCYQEVRCFEIPIIHFPVAVHHPAVAHVLWRWLFLCPLHQRLC